LPTSPVLQAAASWLLEYSPDPTLIVASDQVLGCNPAWTAITGWSAKDTIGRSLLGLIHPEDRARIENLQSPAPLADAELGEFRILKRDGAASWVRLRGNPSVVAPQCYVLENVTPIREQRDAGASAARRARELLRDACGVSSWRFDPDTGVFDVATDFDEPIGSDAGAARQQAVVEMVIHPDDAPEMNRAFRRAVATGDYGMLEYRHFRLEDQRWARCRTAWLGMEQAPSGLWRMIGCTLDVTELADARDAALSSQEAAMAAAAAKEQFLANVSHEIRTPLNGVVGALHLLESEPLSPDGRALHAAALASGAMLTQLLNDVIDLSKMEAGRLALSPEPTELAAVLDGVVRMLEPQAHAKGLTITTSCSDPGAWACVDALRLRQILFNLIGNGIKFTLEGGVKVRMSRAPDNDRLRVEVSDTGIGIPQTVQGQLFQRFEQADASTTRRFGGSGLGLAIAKSLAEMMGGGVGLSSVEGEGSTFWFELEAPACAPAEKVQPQAVKDAPLEGLRVLVVEDNATNRLIVRKMLENLGASVETAGDGVQGVEALAQSAFDLVLMDIQMPRMDGIAATRAIRALAGASSTTPIIAMTANAMAHQIGQYLEAGMDGAIAKPLSPSALLTEILRVASVAAAEVRQPRAAAG
jgi:PAS domain S-box-containing protein